MLGLLKLSQVIAYLRAEWKLGYLSMCDILCGLVLGLLRLAQGSGSAVLVPLFLGQFFGDHQKKGYCLGAVGARKQPHLPQYDSFIGMRGLIRELLEMLYGH